MMRYTRTITFALREKDRSISAGTYESKEKQGAQNLETRQVYRGACVVHRFSADSRSLFSETQKRRCSLKDRVDNDHGDLNRTFSCRRLCRGRRTRSGAQVEHESS